MIVPNSLFSKMMKTTWLKFGTRGTGVAVGEGRAVADGWLVAVGDGVADGEEDAMGDDVAVGEWVEVAGEQEACRRGRQAAKQINEIRSSLTIPHPSSRVLRAAGQKQPG